MTANNAEKKVEHQWDEDEIYQFMIDYFPEICPRNNLTGKNLQMGIKAIQRGKKIIAAINRRNSSQKD